METITDVPTDIPKPAFSYSPYYQPSQNENNNSNNDNNNTALVEEKEGDLNDVTTEGGCHACIIS